MKNRAIFLDRDGVINKDTGYVHKIEDFEFFRDVFLALKKISPFFKIIIITNQAGIAKGIFTEYQYRKLTQFMLQQLCHQGVTIDKVYFCPHHEDGIIKKYRRTCPDRKPGIGMIQKAEKAFDLHLPSCWLIGDKNSDILAGKTSGLKTILLTRHDRDNKPSDIRPDFFSTNLLEAVNIILSQ